jgi:serine protease
MSRARGLLTALAAALVASTAAAQESWDARRQPAAQADTSATSRLLVKLRADAARSDVSKSESLRTFAARNGVRAAEMRRVGARLHVLELGDVEGSGSTDEALERVRRDPDVEYAELDRRRYVHALPNDLLYTGQWYLQSSGRAAAAVDAETGWDVTSGSDGVVVAVLDTGALFDHPDLAHAAAGGRLLPGYDFISSAAAANDGDGRDADASDPGDWVSAADVAAQQFRGCSVADSSWHGTRVAGIIAARTNNAEGVAGMSWTPWVLPVRVIGKCGGFDSDILAAMRWAGGLHVDGLPDNRYPAKIINMSLGSLDSCPASYADVIEELAAVGALIVASAGNEGGPVGAPANCPGVAAIAGVRHTGTKVGYSSLGREITLSAPAGNCVNASGACLYSIDTTSNAGNTTPSTPAYTDQLNYTVGTSFSAPIVAGIAALMASVNGNLGAPQLIARLAEGATKPFPVADDNAVPQCHVPQRRNDVQGSECNCTTETCGAGLANLPGALTAALRPIAVVAVSGTFAAGADIELSAAGSVAACGHRIVGYAWTGVDAQAPGIAGADPAVAVVVPPVTGSYRLRVTVTDDAGRQDQTDVTVTPTEAHTSAPTVARASACPESVTPPLPPIAVTVTPATSSVATGGTQAYAATVVNATDVTVTWHVDGVQGGNATLGTVSADGIYVAPAKVPSPAAVTVSAVSHEDPTRSGTATITVFAAASEEPSPVDNDSGGGGGAIDAWLVCLLLSFLTLRHRRRTRAAFNQQTGV